MSGPVHEFLEPVAEVPPVPGLGPHSCYDFAFARTWDWTLVIYIYISIYIYIYFNSALENMKINCKR